MGERNRIRPDIGLGFDWRCGVCGEIMGTTFRPHLLSPHVLDIHIQVSPGCSGAWGYLVIK